MDWQDLNWKPSNEEAGRYFDTKYLLGVGGIFREDVYAKRIIGLVTDLPAIHITDLDGYCACNIYMNSHASQAHYADEREVPDKPYVWL